MKREKVLNLLDQKGIACLENRSGNRKYQTVKTLFVRDEANEIRYLIILPKEAEISLAAARHVLGAKPLRTVSKKDTKKLLHEERESLTPFDVLNDRTKRIVTAADARLANKLCEIVFPDNSPLYIRTADLAALLAAEDHPVVCADFRQIL